MDAHHAKVVRITPAGQRCIVAVLEQGLGCRSTTVMAAT